jgi:Icc-related predicted phosphoesterase
MRILAISDLHGNLPEIPECDILLIAGDVCPTSNHSVVYQKEWLNSTFDRWLKGIPAKNIVGIFGNHDFIGQSRLKEELTLSWKYLEDSAVEIDGIKIWGTPWQPIFGDWAFNAGDNLLYEKFGKIPAGTDIVLSHCPPYGILDANNSYVHCGSKALWSRISEIRPKASVFGHIHEGRGTEEKKGVKYYNVSYLTMRYKPYLMTPVTEINIGVNSGSN